MIAVIFVYIEFMKKYFLFDDEPITGWGYLFRIVVSSLLTVILVGFWLASATAYKRSGCFGWANDMRVAASVAIPVHIFLNAIPTEVFESVSLGKVDIAAILLTVLHFYLMFKNGNIKRG